MKKYRVTGMSCAACSTRVEKVVSGVSGVSSCSVSLLTNSMMVDGTASSSEILKAVESAGYKAYDETEKSNDQRQKNSLDTQTEISALKKRLVFSVCFLILLMYFSMGHMMWDWPVPAFFTDNHIAMGLIQLILSAVVMVINQKFFINGFKGLVHRAPNMDTLIAIGSSAAFIYSTYSLFLMTAAQLRNDTQAVIECMHEFYFESAAMILALITVGKMLEAYSKGKTTDAVRSLMQLAPDTAVVIRDDDELVIPADQVEIDDIFIVKSGDKVPVDGIVTYGSCAVDESVLTGESMPVDKAEGDKVSAATINRSGYIRCRALRVGEDTTLYQIIKMVSDAAATKAPAARLADKVSGIFVPSVIVIAAITSIIWLAAGYGTGFALARGISVLVISCPCALGLATPVAVMVGNGKGARNGILFKTAMALENTGKTKIAVLDKTGTITKGIPEVTDIVPYGKISPEELLSYAFSLEKLSEHPLAGAIVRKSESDNIREYQIDKFKVFPGNGLTGILAEKELAGGNIAFIGSKVEIPDNAVKTAREFAKEGKTPLMFAFAGAFIGIIAVADVVRNDSRQAIQMIKNLGILVVMLTGDNKYTAHAIGDQVGADKVISDVLPDGKERVINGLKKYGTVAMIGDGINDAPALTAADTGIAIGAGTDVAIDAADVVLVNSRLSDAAVAIRLSRSVLRNIKENLFWAFIFNVIGIPVAAGVFIPLTGLKLNPMFGAMAMSLSSFLVVSNALRLNKARIHDSRHDRAHSNYADIDFEEVIILKKTIKIEGMMCGHCEGRVKKTLEALENVQSAEVSHESGTAVITMSDTIEDSILKSSVEADGYTVTGIE